MKRVSILASVALLVTSPAWAIEPAATGGDDEAPPSAASADRDGGNPPQAPTGDGAGARFFVGPFGGFSPTQSDGLDSGATFGGSFGVFFHRHLGAEFSAQRIGLDVVGTSGNRLSDGDLDATVLTLNVIARVPTGGRVVPYVSGGLAYFDNTVEISSAVRNELAGFNFTAEESIDSAVGFNAGGGVIVPLGGRFGVFGEARYLVASGDSTARLTDRISGVSASETGSQDLNVLTVAAGVRVFF